MIDNLGIKGKFKIENVSTGEIRETNNTVVTIGKAQVAIRTVSGGYAPSDPFGWMSLGLGSSTIAAGDTTLGSEYLRYGLGSITGSTTTTSTTNDSSVWIGSFGMDTTKAVNEAGLFNKSGLDLGSILARTTFATLNVTSGDRVNATWTVDFS